MAFLDRRASDFALADDMTCKAATARANSLAVVAHEGDYAVLAELGLMALIVV